VTGSVNKRALSRKIICVVVRNHVEQRAIITFVQLSFLISNLVQTCLVVVAFGNTQQL
jgi:hypothetical protein